MKTEVFKYFHLLIMKNIIVQVFEENVIYVYQLTVLFFFLFPDSIHILDQTFFSFVCMVEREGDNFITFFIVNGIHTDTDTPATEPA